MVTKKFWSSDKLVALTALIISLFSLFIFIRQTNIIEKQTRLSVMPYLIFDSSVNGDNKTFAIDFVNHGAGPAIIESTHIVYKGREYRMQLHEFLESEIVEMDSVNVMNYSTLLPGFAIQSGGKRNILRVGGDETSYRSFLKIFDNLMNNGFEYRLNYKSIYNDKWTVESTQNIPMELD